MPDRPESQEQLWPDGSSGPASKPNSRQREAPSILVVDNNDATRRVIAEVLGELGYAVICAAGARATDHLCRSLTEAPVLALIAFRLGDGRGDQLAARLRTRWPRCFILYSSGSDPSYDEALRAALLAPATALLTQPTSLATIEETVRLRIESTTDASAPFNPAPDLDDS